MDIQYKNSDFTPEYIDYGPGKHCAHTTLVSRIGAGTFLETCCHCGEGRDRAYRLVRLNEPGHGLKLPHDFTVTRAIDPWLVDEVAEDCAIRKETESESDNINTRADGNVEEQSSSQLEGSSKGKITAED